jgi:hypothetical protein
MATNRVKAALEKTDSDTAKRSKDSGENDAKRYAKLEGKTRAGDFVHANQKMAKDEGFRNVSKIWYDKCKSFDWAFEQIGADHKVTRDVRCNLDGVSAAVNRDGSAVVLRFEDGEYRPSDFAWMKIGPIFGLNTQFFNYALDSWSVSAGRGRDGGKIEFHPERVDYEMMAEFLNRRIEIVRNSRAGGKEWLFRLNDRDHTVRVMMTSEYVCIDNRWYLEILRDLIPDGLISHWRGDEDNLYTNVLIPDTIREDSDSDYGGMIGAGNSEIGFRALSCVPSLFRAICMNGCIWDQEKGDNIKQVHRGESIKDNLAQLRTEIVKCINDQIPLIGQGIDVLLGTKAMRWDGASIKPLVMRTAKEFSLTKPPAGKVLESYRTEVNECPANINTLFGLVNGVTRAAQSYDDPVTWERMNEVGGRLARMDGDDWDSLRKAAHRLKANEVDSFFAVSAN